MAVAPTYTLELDRNWLPVPLAFPWGVFPDAEAWAAEVVDSLLAGTGVPAEGQEQLRATALTLQAMPGPLPGAVERFWRTEYVGGPAMVAHLYVTDIAAETTDELLQLSRGGIGGRVQTWTSMEDTAFTVAVQAVVVAEIGETAIAALRHLGVRDGYVFLLDFLTEDPMVLEAVQDELATTFRSIRFKGEHGADSA